MESLLPGANFNFIIPLVRNRLNKLQSYSLPSDYKIDLTLGTSGTRYTAPADGWIYLNKKTGDNNQFIEIAQNGANRVYYNKNNAALMLHPVAKGTFTVTYTASGTTGLFAFYYAVGSEPQT